MRAFGADIILVTKEEGMMKARDIAETMNAEGKGKMLDQFATSTAVSATPKTASITSPCQRSPVRKAWRRSSPSCSRAARETASNEPLANRGARALLTAESISVAWRTPKSDIAQEKRITD